MSWLEARDPECMERTRSDRVETIIAGRPRDIGLFSVRRVLPSHSRRMVGPFIFFDHMGPAELPLGRGIDVRPHPHLNLATVTYLFEGEILHRDSLGYEQPIQPGAVNWMTAGRGIVHSERTPSELRKAGSRLHGIQLWVALPTEHEETEPAFDHYPKEAMPDVTVGSIRLRVLAGSAYGVASPVKTLSRLFYVDAQMPAGADLTIPDDYPERAAYVVSGRARCGPAQVDVAQMALFSSGSAALRAETACRVMLLGGDGLDGERHIWWNFVSSSKERLERAKAEWRGWPASPSPGARFSMVPGDDSEFIPLPAE